MARTRISTTVAEARLLEARALTRWRNDAEMMDAALAALIGQHRDTIIDAAYAAGYEQTPPHTPDAWGDLAAFREAAARS